jgi:hypothetical protein
MTIMAIGDQTKSQPVMTTISPEKVDPPSSQESLTSLANGKAFLASPVSLAFNGATSPPWSPGGGPGPTFSWAPFLPSPNPEIKSPNIRDFLNIPGPKFD